jgi:hypothetical protein
MGILCIAMTMFWRCAPLWAGEAPSTQPSAAVAELIDRLGSDDFATREAAQKALADMGDVVEPQLRGLLGGDIGDEARARINGVLHAIEEKILLGPSIITMHYKNAPVQMILEDFARQARADLGVHRPRIVEYVRDHRASIDVDHASFWDTLNAIADSTGLRPAPFTAESAMVLDINEGDAPNLFARKLHQSGAFAIIALPSRWNRAVHPRAAVSGLNLIVVAEPKLHVLGPTVTNDWLKECLDSKGAALSTSTFFNGGPWWWQFRTMVHSSPDAGGKIALLRGEMKFSVQTRADVFETDDLSKLQNVTRIVNQTAITLKQFTNRNGKYELEMTFAGSAQLNQWQWNRIQNVIATIQVLDDQDQPLQHRLGGIGSGENLNLVIEYITNDAHDGSISNTGAPKKLRWEVATETRTVSVPFELRDLDLP